MKINVFRKTLPSEKEYYYVLLQFTINYYLKKKENNWIRLIQLNMHRLGTYVYMKYFNYIFFKPLLS